MAVKLFPVPANKGERARRRLLVAALARFAEKGYEAASIREIAEAAGQNVAAIAYYFGSKQKLYAAVLEGIGGYLRGVFAGSGEELRARLEAGTLDAAVAVESLKGMLRTLLGVQFGGGDFEKLHHIMVREQTAPSECFEILYRDTLRLLHERMTTLLAAARGEDPAAPEVILRAHALFGQAICFTWARPTILRRLGVRKLDARHQAAIGALLDEHIELICHAHLPSTP